MSEQASSEAWRRRLRLSVRGLILLVLAIGAGLGWMVHRAHLQRDAVAAIRRAGGTIGYEWEVQHGYFVPGSQRARPRAPGWLVDRVGVDYFGSVLFVDLLKRGSDADLVLVGNLSRLESLGLNWTPLTDAGLAYLTGLTRLRELALMQTRITDAGLAHLRGLTSLEDLWLADTRITDAGLAHLTGLTRLRQLWLKGTQVTDAGVGELRRALPNLLIYR
jgi:hypothetical protein